MRDSNSNASAVHGVDYIFHTAALKQATSFESVELTVAMFENREEIVLANDYADTKVSVKVVKLIQSYAKIVDRLCGGNKIA